MIKSGDCKFKVIRHRKLKHFIINNTWDGVFLPVEQQAKVSVRWLLNGDLNIHIDSPFSNDPKPKCYKELWNYEVIELFIAGVGEPVSYTEIEISPWGDYLVLQLLGRRQVVGKELPLKIIKVNRDSERWQSEVVIQSNLIPKGPLKVNAYRIFGVEPLRHYHVMTPLKTIEPDFHAVDQFTQELVR